jgi:hypothetical protein
MIRLSYIIWLAFFMALIIALFQVKYTVQQLGERRDASIQEIDDTKERIRKLRLEWEQLNQPRRLTSLSQDFLEQFGTNNSGAISPVDQIPVRPENLQPVAYLTIEEPEKGSAPIVLEDGQNLRDIGSLRPIHAPDMLGAIILQHADSFSTE